MENLNYLFNKSFYDELCVVTKHVDGQAVEMLAIPDIAEKVRRLFGTVFISADFAGSTPAQQKFLMKTCYPGLITGSGNVHGVSVEDDIKIGFTFDYVTGQPYIPGSTVKGVVKTYFEAPDVVRSLTGKDFSPKQLEALTRDIFEEGVTRDVFLDAVIKHGDKDGKLLSGDYITHHPSPIKAPNPVQFVKVLPDVVFEFRFILRDSVIDGETLLTADEKTELFKAILATFGAGAKTNLGYGVLIPVSEEEDSAYRYPTAPAQTAQSRPAQTAQSRPAQNTQDAAAAPRIEVGAVVRCKVTGIKDFGAFVKILNTDKSGLIHISQIANFRIESVADHLSVGDEVRARIIKIENGKIGLSIKQAND